MRYPVAIVVGGVVGFGLLLLFGFLLDGLTSLIGVYAFVVIAVVVGLLVGAIIGVFSKALGTIVGLVVVILLSLVGTILELQDLGDLVVRTVAAPLSYFMAGFIAGAISGVTFGHGYTWWRGARALVVGVLACILLLGIHLAVKYTIGGEVMDVSTIMVDFAIASLVGAVGGAVGGQLGGVKV